MRVLHNRAVELLWLVGSTIQRDTVIGEGGIDAVDAELRRALLERLRVEEEEELSD